MRAVDLAVRVVDRVRAIGVCLFCDVYDHGIAHSPTCPVGEYERTALARGRRFIATEYEGRDSVRQTTPAEHFRRCGPFCAHVQHCPKCANVHGFCGGHATPDDAIRWADPKGGES